MSILRDSLMLAGICVFVPLIAVACSALVARFDKSE